MVVGWGGGLFYYSVTQGPFIWEFDTKSVNMKVKKVCWWGGGLFDFSVTTGPFFWSPDNLKNVWKIKKKKLEKF